MSELLVSAEVVSEPVSLWASDCLDDLIALAPEIHYRIIKGLLIIGYEWPKRPFVVAK